MGAKCVAGFITLLFIQCMAQPLLPPAGSPQDEPSPVEQPPPDSIPPSPSDAEPPSEPVVAPSPSPTELPSPLPPESAPPEISPSESIPPALAPSESVPPELPPSEPAPGPSEAVSPSPTVSASPAPSESIPPPPTVSVAPSPAPLPISSFCARSRLRKTCPSPPTFDYIQLPSYSGKWYEIGATATTKLITEAGTICNQAMYTVPNTTAFAQAPNMSVTNIGFHVAGPMTSLGVQQIATATSSACSGARTVCERVSNESRATKGAMDLASVATELEDAEFASDLLELQSRIFGAMSEVDSTMDLFSTCMESIQRIDGELSQSELYQNVSSEIYNRTLQAQTARLQTLDGLLDQANALLDSLKQSVRKMMDCTPKIVSISAQLLFIGDLENSVRLTAASTDISTGGDAILTQVLGIRMTLKGVAAARGLINLATSGSSTNATAVPRFDTSAGFAIQNTTSPGKLQLQLTTPVPPPSAPYWILSLRGRAMQGYRASLVYSCSQNDGTGTIHQGMFILSRTPGLPQKIVNELLQLAATFGINTDCDDPFLFTVHHGKMCGVPPH